MIVPDHVRKAFLERVGRSPRMFAAPGRVNLIGEHTDYNDGFVLPMAIDRTTVAAGTATGDRRVRVHSLDLREDVEIDLDAPPRRMRGHWVDYIEGVARALLARGVPLVGADLVLGSDVPSGAGLSSSAALELAVALALVKLSGASTDGVTLALAGQAAEHEYVGTKCGIMDQLIAALGQADHALLIDCRSLEHELVPMRAPETSVVLCDSKVKHDLASSAYNARRAECERGVELLRAKLPDIAALRDVSARALDRVEDVLPEPIRRRCRHVVEENARTLAAREALQGDALDELGRLFYASHHSLRDDYAVSCDELDLLVEAASEAPGVFGARMTGGGFGGCTVNLVRTEAVPEFVAHVSQRFAHRFGRRPEFFTTRACDGARELT